MTTSTVGRRLGRVALASALVVGIGLIWLRSGSGWASDDASRSRQSDAILVVNADRPLPDGFSIGDLVPLVHKVPVADAQVKVAAEVERPLRKLFAAARQAGHTRLYVASGYRTAEEQQELWDEADDKSFVQRPGHSEHQTGLAVDLADLKVGQGKFGVSKAGRWLARNAWRYGFVLRYPAGKEQITGISYEPWHYRYVGTAVARSCHQRHLVLEEYVAAR
nr:M15 family metallopeptidase [Propionicimonas sp.]